MPSITITKPTTIKIGWWKNNTVRGGGTFSQFTVDGKTYINLSHTLDVDSAVKLTWWFDSRSKSWGVSAFVIYSGDEQLYRNTQVGNHSLDILFEPLNTGGGGDYTEGKYRVLSPVGTEVIGGSRVPIVRTESVQTLSTRDAQRLTARGYTIEAVPDSTPSFSGRDYPVDVAARAQIIGEGARRLRTIPAGRRDVKRLSWRDLGLNASLPRYSWVSSYNRLSRYESRRNRQSYVW